MIITETQNLSITKLAITDATFIFELVNSQGWLTYIGDRGIRTITDAEKYIVNGPLASYHKNGHGLYKVSLKKEKAAIGICGIIQRDTLADKDLGFALLPAYTGKGYAFEAAAATLQYAKEVLQLKRIVAITMPANESSVRLLSKLGMVVEKKVCLPPGNEELLLFTTI